MPAVPGASSARTLLASIACLLFLTSCGRAEAPFLESNARAHLNRLAGAIGSRWIGTDRNRQAREYLIEQLRLYGFDVRVQQADARRPDLGITARIANIIALKPGVLPLEAGALALAAHYDSRPDTPGAGDDGLGTAVCVEAARVLASRPHRHALMVLLTDGEEPGLLGAAALVSDPALAPVRAILNLEAIGSSEPAVLFQASPDSDWLLRAWAAHAPRPRGSSYGIEIYKRLPNDTDFTIFQTAGRPGLNFAAVGESFAYHTARDGPERVSARLLRQAGQNLVATVQALDVLDLPATARPVPTGPSGLGSAIDSIESARQTSTTSIYFSVIERAALTYSNTVGHALAAAAVLLGALAWLNLMRAARELVGWRGVLMTGGWTLVGLVVVSGAMLGATWALRASREVFHPWYAHPVRLVFLLVVSAAAAGWLLRQAGNVLPRAIQGSTHPAVIWVVTLPVWIGLTAILEWKAASAAYLWSWPLACAGILFFAIGGRSEVAVRVASFLVCLAAVALWLPDTILIIPFAVAALGREPIVTPVFVYPALLLLTGHVPVPPFLAVLSGRLRPMWHPALTTAALLTLVAIAAGLAYAAPAYTHERSLRRQVRYINDGLAGRAYWEVSSNEPGLDLSTEAGVPTEWTPTASPPPTSVPLRPLPQPFVFRAPSSVDAQPPALVSTVFTQNERGLVVEINVLPAEAGLTLAFVMPPRLIPSDPNLTGVVRNGRWRATYVAPPAEGVTFRSTFIGASRDTFRDAAVLVQSSGLPGERDWQRLPTWLPQERTVWTGWAYWLLPVVSQ